jgi:hypothetical protein
VLRLTAITPDGRRLTISHYHDGWTVTCADHEGGKHEHLADALRAFDADEVTLHARRADASWIREWAERLEQQRPGDEEGSA